VSHFANQALQAYLRDNGTNSYDTKALAVEAAKGNIDERMEEWAKPTMASRTQPALLASYLNEEGRNDLSPSILPHLVIASGGNAGLAAASAARLLGLQCTIFVPDAQANIVHMFERHGTNGRIKVKVGGVNYYEALTAARAFKDQLGERGSVFIFALSSAC
jgi:threonine synthase